MGTIEFKGEPPFDLTLQQRAIASFSGGSVMLTLPVHGGGSPPKAVEIQVTMSIESALHLHDQLPSAVEKARKELWSGR
jgi:hypothetical protein